MSRMHSWPSRTSASATTGRWTCRAWWPPRCANVRQGRVDQGFSTITMQLARNVFPDQLPASRRTLSRKLLEVRVAQEIEHSFSKDEILEMYLNHIYFGHGARGIEAAARHYFGRPARELDVAQAAMLAALPKAPTHYDPRRQPERAKERRDLVLTLMEQQGRLTPEAAQAARVEPLRVAARPGVTAVAAAARRLVRRGGAPRARGDDRARPLRREAPRPHDARRRRPAGRPGGAGPPARVGREGRARPLLRPRLRRRAWARTWT